MLKFTFALALSLGILASGGSQNSKSTVPVQLNKNKAAVFNPSSLNINC
jgi:hypothetical protein